MTELIQAAKAGSVLDVQKILKENNIDVNYQDIDYSYTALYWAAANGHVDVCRYLINKKANINLQSKWGGSPLYVASYNGQCGTVHMLLSHGANVNLADNQQRTPLHAAAYKGHLTVCEKLLDGGASVEAINADGKTPVVEAQGEGHQRIVSLFNRHVQKFRRGPSASTSCISREKYNESKKPRTGPLPLPVSLSNGHSNGNHTTKSETGELSDKPKLQTHCQAENGNQFTQFSESHSQEKRYLCSSSQTNCPTCQQSSMVRPPSQGFAKGPVGGAAVLNTAANSSSMSKSKLMEMIEALQLQVAMKNDEIENLKFTKNQQDIIYAHNIEKLTKELEEEREKRRKVQGHCQFLGNQLRYRKQDGDHGLFDNK